MSQSFDTLIQQGVSASQADDPERALACFLQASQAEPGAGLPHFLAAGELAQQGRLQEAEAAYATAVLLSPDLTIARYQLGLLHFATDRLALALTTWQPLLGLDESDFMRHFVQGFYALAIEDSAAAEAHFRRGLSMNTSNAPMNHDIERVLSSLATIQSAVPAPAQASASDDAEAAHVLLSNYHPAGKPN